MKYSARWFRSFALAAALTVRIAHAGEPADRIFASGFLSALVIEGSANYPAPLAHAHVEAHFGDTVATATTAADGSYRVGLETDQIDPRTIVEVFARGSGAQTKVVWASPLGPASRLLSLAGSNLRVGFEQEPFVHLSPRSTVAAAAARAFNDWQPITDETTFWRAVRSRQNVTDHLVFALALVARSELALPEGSTDTFDAVSSLSKSQELFTAYYSLNTINMCGWPATWAFCDVYRNLPRDARMFPPVAWVPGELYSQATPFRSLVREVFALRPNATGATVLPSNGTAVPATVTVLSDGGYELAPAEGSDFFSEEEWVRGADGFAVRSIRHVTRLYVKLTRGPGGQVEFGWSGDVRRTYPDEPNTPEDYTPYDPTVMPRLSASSALPEKLASNVPTLNGHRWALTSPIFRQQDASVDLGPHGYEVHAFGDTSGHAERSGQAFTFALVSPTAFTLDTNGRHAEFLFVNEEEPGVWQMQMHVTADGYENVVTGLLVPADAGPMTTAGVVGTWRSRIYGDVCSGPYGDLGSCDQDLHFQFRPDGTATRLHGSAESGAGSWSLTEGADAGRLLFDLQVELGPGYIDGQRRGWELIHETAGHRWVLETFNYDYAHIGLPPPVVFNPTMRLIRYDRE